MPRFNLMDDYQRQRAWEKSNLAHTFELFPCNLNQWLIRGFSSAFAVLSEPTRSLTEILSNA